MFLCAFFLFSFFFVFFCFSLGTPSIVHDLLEDVAMARTDKSRKVNVNGTSVIHRPCLVATPVLADVTHIRHEYRKVLVAIIDWFKHTVAEASMLEAFIVGWALIPYRVCLHSKVLFAFLVVSRAVWFEMPRLTTVTTSAGHSHSANRLFVFLAVANHPALLRRVPSPAHFLELVLVFECFARHREQPVGLNCEFHHSFGN